MTNKEDPNYLQLVAKYQRGCETEFDLLAAWHEGRYFIIEDESCEYNGMKVNNEKIKEIREDGYKGVVLYNKSESDWTRVTFT